MCGDDDARWRLARAAEESDLILIEGVMGLFDGNPSSADIATRFGIPVLCVVDARAMAQTFGAVALGLSTYRPGLPFAGALGNKVGSPYHADLLIESLPPSIAWYGNLAHDKDASLPERHLGILQASEIDDLEGRLDRLAASLGACAARTDLPPPVELHSADAPRPGPLLKSQWIAVARDAAFGFIYPANVEALESMGAELCYFSPLAGESLPEGGCDAVWLPGGYPELHADGLGKRGTFWAALRRHALEEGKPVLAECGGMMSLLEELVDKEGVPHRMAGLLPGRVVMGQGVAALGTLVVDLPEGTIRGHTYHFSKTETQLEPLARAATLEGRPGEAVYRCNRITATYMHLYFPSNPEAVAALF
jgi:cobyrinic acid a,c-diamide synthase